MRRVRTLVSPSATALFAIALSVEQGCSSESEAGSNDTRVDLGFSDNSGWYCGDQAGESDCRNGPFAEVVEAIDVDVIDVDVIDGDAADMDSINAAGVDSDVVGPWTSDNSGWYCDGDPGETNCPDLDAESLDAEPDVTEPAANDADAMDLDGIEGDAGPVDVSHAPRPNGLDWARLAFCAPDGSRRGLTDWRGRPSPFAPTPST